MFAQVLFSFCSLSIRKNKIKSLYERPLLLLLVVKKKKKEQMEMNKMTMKPAGMVKEWIKVNAISFIIIYIYSILLDSLNALGF